MEMRCPAAVFLDVADIGEVLALRDTLAELKCVESVSCEVAVKCEEFRAVAGGVTNNHKRTVVERGGVDRDGVDHAVKGRVEGRAGHGEQIYPEMNGAAF